MQREIGQGSWLDILDSFDEGIYVTDRDGMTLAVNASYERMTGIRAGDVIGRKVDELVQEGILSESITSRVIASGRDEVMGQTIFSGGKKRSVMLQGRPVRDRKTGDITHVVTFVRDVTTINEMRRKIAEQEELVALYKKKLRKQTGDLPLFITGEGAFKQTIDLAGRVAAVDSTVLILGESGTGKEVVAREIHRRSHRKEKKFLEINCGAVPESLLESELFGYVGGAFTGADRHGHKGLFEEATEGTLFLDEIGDMPLYLQVKLLKVLQDHEVTPVGSTNPVPVATRIIAATNRDLQQMIRDKTFREDLYYRLNIVVIRTPPLRERREDIPELVNYFVDKINAKYDLDKRLAPEVISSFLEYHWPGNVRELENIIERILVTSSSEIVSAQECVPYADGIVHEESLSERGREFPNGFLQALHGMSLEEAYGQVEREMILYTAAKYHSTYKMAKHLHISQSTASRKLRKYRAESEQEEL